jgi:hypothetical protein
VAFGCFALVRLVDCLRRFFGFFSFRRLERRRLFLFGPIELLSLLEPLDPICSIHVRTFARFTRRAGDRADGKAPCHYKLNSVDGLLQ